MDMERSRPLMVLDLRISASSQRVRSAERCAELLSEFMPKWSGEDASWGSQAACAMDRGRCAGLGAGWVERVRSRRGVRRRVRRRRLWRLSVATTLGGRGQAEGETREE